MYVHTPSTTNVCSGVNFKKKIGAGFDTSSVLVERRSLGYHCSPCLIHVYKLYFLIGHCLTALSIFTTLAHGATFGCTSRKILNMIHFSHVRARPNACRIYANVPGRSRGVRQALQIKTLVCGSVQPSVPSGRTCMKAVTLPC